MNTLLLSKSLRNSLFDDFLVNWDKAFFNEDYSYWRKGEEVRSRELDNSYEYYAPFAGFKKKDIKANVQDGVVSLFAKSSESSVSYSFLLPNEVDASTLSAKYEDGLLTVKVNKKKKAKKIELKVT